MKNIVRVIFVILCMCVCSGCATTQQSYQPKIIKLGVITNIPVGINEFQIWEYVAKERPELPNNPKEGYWIPLRESGDPAYNDWEFKPWDNENFSFPERNLNPESGQVVDYGYEAAQDYIRALFIETPSFCVHRNKDGSQVGKIVELEPENQPWWEERSYNLNSYQKWILEVTMGAPAEMISTKYGFMLSAIERAEGWDLTKYPTCQN